MAFAEDFIQGHLAGQKERLAQEEFDAQLEQRKWIRDIKKKELERQALQDKLTERLGQRGEALQNAQLQEGGEGSYTSLPNQGANPGNAAFGLPGGPAPTPAGAGMTIPPVTIPGAYSDQSVTVQPKTAFQIQKIQDAIAARLAAEKRAEKGPSWAPSNSPGYVDPATQAFVPTPQHAAKEDRVTNEVELFQKDPEAWAKMIKTKAALDHIMNPQQETDAKFQWRIWKTDPKGWEQVYGAGKKQDEGQRLLNEYNLAEKIGHGGTPEEIAAEAQRIHNIVDKARAGGTSDPFAALVPPKTSAAPAAPGLFERLFGGGQAPAAPAPPPSVMPSQYDPGQLQRQGYKKVKGGWQKQK